MEFGAVNPPDEAVRQAAEERHARLTKPRGSLGRLEELGTWLAACQGQCPPRPLSRPRVVVFAGDHGVATKGVSAYPSEVTAQMVANFQAGGAAINVLAGVAGATVRVVDMAVATDTTAATHKIRHSSGAIDQEDALTQDEVEAALAAGRAIADEEVDAGADLLVAGDMGIGNTTPAAVLVAAITGAEPVAVVGRGTGIDDQTWMRKTAAIRDALRRAKPVTADPVALLRTTAGADIAAMAAFLAQAAIRQTPVVLDGVVSGAAALLAEELAPGARAWWVAGHRSTEPAHTLVLEQLDLKPLLEMNMRLGEGSGATAAIPLLTMAVQILTDMATFEDAGVSGPSPEPPTQTATTEEPATPEPEATAADEPEPGETPSTTEDEAASTPPPATEPDPADSSANDTAAATGAGTPSTTSRPATEPNATTSPASDTTPATGTSAPSTTPPPATEPGPTNNSASTPTSGTPEATPLPAAEPGPANNSANDTTAATGTGAPDPTPPPAAEPGPADSSANDTTPATGAGTSDTAPQPGTTSTPTADPDPANDTPPATGAGTSATTPQPATDVGRD